MPTQKQRWQILDQQLREIQRKNELKAFIAYQRKLAAVYKTYPDHYSF